jgi:hypothetical protein
MYVCMYLLVCMQVCMCARVQIIDNNNNNNNNNNKPIWHTPFNIFLPQIISTDTLVTPRGRIQSNRNKTLKHT